MNDTNSSSYLVSAQNLNKHCKVSSDITQKMTVLHLNRRIDLLPTITYGFERQESFIDTITVFYTIINETPPPLRMKVTLVNFSNNVVGKFVKNDFQAGENTQTIVLGKKGRIKNIIFEYQGTADYVGSAITIESVYFYTMNPLTELANKYGSDKGSTMIYNGKPHLYTEIYHRYFEKLRNRKLNILEIGLDTATHLRGQPINAPSLFMWRDYFPKSQVYGIDINNYDFLESEERITFFRANQSSRTELSEFIKEHPVKFDIIIDDGSHASSHQQIAMATLLPRLKKGGFYIVESLFWQPFKEELATTDLFDTYEYSGIFESPYITKEESKVLTKKIAKFKFLKAQISEILLVQV